MVAVNPLKRGIPLFALAVLMAWPTLAQSKDDSDLRQEIDQLKAQLKTLQSELEEIKATLREQTARTNPTFDISGDPALGDPAAKLVLIEFSDFECPYCSEYFKTIYRQVLDGYVKTNKVRYVFGDFPGEKIHPHALKAAEAARCANEQGKFWEMHDQLFTRQRDLGATGIEDSAKGVGLNLTDFDSCLAAGRYTAKVKEAEQSTANLGLQGTPAFVFGIADPANPSKVKLLKALVGAQPYAQFQQVIDSLLSK
jgi:protein-disulfide isomerase